MVRGNSGGGLLPLLLGGLGRRGVLNDKDQHLHLQLMEPEEEADHLHLVQRILPKVVNEVWED